MGYTKRQFVTAALEEIGMASYVFDLSPEQMESSLRRLDAMLAGWYAKGIRLGYPLPINPQDSTLDQQTDVPDAANEAIITNLGMKLAPSYGKTVMPETKQTAKDTFNTLLMRSSQPMEMQLPNTMPMGAGNKPWRNDDPFMPVPDDPMTDNGFGQIEFN